MTKSLANKILLKEAFVHVFMGEGTLIQNHLDDFNSMLINLESLEVKIEDGKKFILLVVSLSSSYKHFKIIRMTHCLLRM